MKNDGGIIMNPVMKVASLAVVFAVGYAIRGLNDSERKRRKFKRKIKKVKRDASQKMYDLKDKAEDMFDIAEEKVNKAREDAKGTFGEAARTVEDKVAEVKKEMNR